MDKELHHKNAAESDGAHLLKGRPLLSMVVEDMDMLASEPKIVPTANELEQQQKSKGGPVTTT